MAPTAQLQPAGAEIKVIAITRSPEVQAVIEQIAKKRGWVLSGTDSMMDALEREDVATAVTLIDGGMFETDWKQVIADLWRPPHRSCLILMTPNPTDRFCHEFIQQGGYSVLKMPLQPVEVADAVRLAVAFWRACVSWRCRR